MTSLIDCLIDSSTDLKNRGFERKSNFSLIFLVITNLFMYMCNVCLIYMNAVLRKRMNEECEFLKHLLSLHLLVLLIIKL